MRKNGEYRAVVLGVSIQKSLANVDDVFLPKRFKSILLRYVFGYYFDILNLYSWEISL